MKKNSTLEKKLLKYSAMASGVVAMGTAANAQITYVDENPDIVVTGHQDFYAFDFDADGNPDVGMITWDGSGSGSDSSTGGATWTSNSIYKGASGYAYSGAGVLTAPEQVLVDINGTTTGVINATFAAKLNTNDVINSSGTFGTGQVGLGFVISSNFNPALMGNTAFPQGITTASWASAWTGAVDKYMGFNFTSNGNIHYGWIRLDQSVDGGTVTMKDWAYNTTPDQQILAGQQTLGVAEAAQELALVRFVNNRLDVNVINGTNGNLSVVGMDGKVVYNGAINTSVNSIDLSNLAAGIYVVNAEFNQGGIQHKIVVR